MAELLLVTALALIVGPLITYALYASPRRRIGYIPLPHQRLPQVIEALNLRNDSILIDLGCGDGRVLAAALRSNPKIQAIGVEINPPVTWLARWRLRKFKNRAQINRRDLFDVDLTAATQIFTYLNNQTMGALEPKFERELSSGCRLVSCDFPLPHRQASKKIKIGEGWQLGQTLYIYEY